MVSEIVMITSGKGGVGKTTATAFLGAELSRMDKSVVLIDTDFGLRNLDLQFSLDKKIIYNIVDVLDGTCSLRQALLPLNHQGSLCILPGSKDYHYTLRQRDFVHVLEKLTKQFDFIIIDTPAGILDTHLKMLPCVTQVILVTTFTDAAIRDAITMSSVIKKYQVPARIMFNQMMPSSGFPGRKQHLFYLSQDVFQLESLGIFPYLEEHGRYHEKKIQKTIKEICELI